MRPVCAIYSTFLQRAFDPIVHDVCLQKLPVVFCMDRAGLSGDDGPTHHGLFDIAYLRGIPEMVLMAPRNEDELSDMMKTALTLDGPSAIRYPRGIVEGNGRKDKAQLLPVGKAEILRPGDPLHTEVALFAIGPMVTVAEEAARRLESLGFVVAVVNARFVKPLDTEVVRTYAAQGAVLVTLEDHVKMGGFGAAVLEALDAMQLQVPVIRVGWPDQFIEHGKVDQLRSRYGLSVEAVVDQVLPLATARRTAQQPESDAAVRRIAG